jgi:hypothetical protein
MRATTKTVMSAFLDGRSKTVKNTRTDGRTVWLHGHAIIRRDGSGIEFTLAGWNTVTTRERLNGFFALIGSPYRVFQKDFVPHLRTPTCSHEISVREWIVVTGLSAEKLAA